MNKIILGLLLIPVLLVGICAVSASSDDVGAEIHVVKQTVDSLSDIKDVKKLDSIPEKQEPQKKLASTHEKLEPQKKLASTHEKLEPQKKLASTSEETHNALDSTIEDMMNRYADYVFPRNMPEPLLN